MTQSVTAHADNRAEQRSWYWYDWANSAFSTTVITVFLGPYLTDIANTAAESGQQVTLLGVVPVAAGSYFPFVVAISVALQVLLMPIAGALADRSASKKTVMGIGAYVGAFATMALFFVDSDNYQLGGILFIVANTAFGCAVVVYDSFLPDIAAPAERDAVSSRGWAMGYLGGVILVIINLALFLQHDSFGLTEGTAVRISLLSAGAWWAIFTLIPMKGLRDRPAKTTKTQRSTGITQLLHTVRSLPATPQALLFILAFFFFNDGIQTVIGLTATFAEEELQLSTTIVILTVLITQIVGFFGSLALGRLAGRLGAQRVVIACIAAWGLMLVGAFLLPVGTTAPFLALGAFIGFILGGTQALSRSLFAQLVPRDREAEYFSLYEITGGASSLLGPIVFGLSLMWLDSYRIAILALVIFFLVGGVLLSRVDVERGMAQARA